MVTFAVADKRASVLMKDIPHLFLIEVSVTQEGEKTTITVSDHGPGMTESVRQHIFDKFYQGDASRTTKGNGLGLALVKRIVELHGGTVEVTTQQGNGSEFVVML